MERAAQAVRTYFEQEAPKGRFLVGTHNANRLNRALRVGQLSHLINRTLLSRAIHQHHTHRLFDRLVRLCGKKRNTDIQFLTVLHKLAVLDAPTCLKEVRRFRTLLDDTFGQCQGSHILGTIECEVVSVEMMRTVLGAGEPSTNAKHKLNVVEQLFRKSFPKKYQATKQRPHHLLPVTGTDPSYFLIHFHGVVVEHRPYSILAHVLKRSFGQVPNQVLLQPLSEQFNGKTRTVRENLKFIARYITKGGNDFNDGQSYLRYKMKFTGEVCHSEEEWVARNWRTHEVLRQEHIEEGLNDPLSLTTGEICQLATVLDGMMGWSRSRTGYVYERKTPSRRKSSP